MIPIQLSPEPTDFNTRVREKGNQWINNHPNSDKYPALWADYLPYLAMSRQQICSYYSIYLEPSSGAETVDHFKPKSKHRNLVYEWCNYRYCCLDANRKKHIYEDVIDPIKLPLETGKHTFEIDFSDGSVRANPSLSTINIQVANTTIKRLKLNDIKLKNSRMDYLYLCLTNKIEPSFLKARSPFVYAEALRQGLLSIP